MGNSDSTDNKSSVTINSRIDGKPAGIPLVSAIIPSYNASKFVHRAIESALSQTHHLFEIIVVDDGSVDSTVDVVSRFPVKLIRQPNGGPASARNNGIMNAESDWLAFLDHDDVWHSEKTEKQLKYVERNVSAVFCAKDPEKSEFSFEDIYWHNLGGAPSSTIIRRDTLIKLGMFDDDRALIGVEDYNMWLRFIYNGYKFKATPQLFEFTPAEGNYSSNEIKMFAAEMTNIEKIGKIANISVKKTAERKRRLRLEYIKNFINARDISAARDELRTLGLDFQAMRYWPAFLPVSILNLRRDIARKSNSRRS